MIEGSSHKLIKNIYIFFSFLKEISCHLFFWIIFYQEREEGTEEMAQCLRVLGALLEDWDPIPCTQCG